MKRATKSVRWMLVVRDGRRADMMLHRMQLRPSRYSPGEYVGFYPLHEKARLLSDIERLKAVGLHGVARKIAVAKKPRAQSRPRPVTERRPDAQIIELINRQQVRLQHDAERRKATAAEHRKAAAARERRALASETDVRARQALLRAKGEM